MDRNNKGEAVLIESDNNFPVGLSTLFLDDDEQSFQDIVTSFENCCHPCKANSCTIGGQPFVEDFPSLPYDFFYGLPNLDTGGIFGDPNQQKSPSANNTLGFNLPLPVESKSLTIEGNTICGNQSNTSMTQMAQAPLSEQLRNEFTGGQRFVHRSLLNDIDVSMTDIHVLDEFSNLDTLQGGIYGELGFFNNAPVPSSYEACTVNELKKEGIRVSPPRINKSYQVQQQTNREARKRMKWTTELKQIFLKAVKKLGIDEATPRAILKFMKASRGAPKDLTREHVASHLQKVRLKIKRKEDKLRDEIMNTTYHPDLSSSPQQLATAAGNMCLQPNVGTQVLQNIQLPLSSGTIEGTIMQDQALVANVAGMFNNTSLPSSSQYKAVDANETAMPGNGSNYFTRLESPDNDNLHSLLNDFSSYSQDCVFKLEDLFGWNSSKDCGINMEVPFGAGNGPNNTSDDTDFDIEDCLNDDYMSS